MAEVWDEIRSDYEKATQIAEDEDAAAMLVVAARMAALEARLARIDRRLAAGLPSREIKAKATKRRKRPAPGAAKMRVR